MPNNIWRKEALLCNIQKYLFVKPPELNCKITKPLYFYIPYYIGPKYISYKMIIFEYMYNVFTIDNYNLMRFE